MAYIKTNCVISFKKKGDTTTSEFQSEISDFKDEALTKTVTYKKFIGGIIVPIIEEIISKKIGFDFIVEDFNILKLLQPDATTEINTFESTDRWKIVVQFQSETDTISFIFYDCIIETFNTMFDDEVLMGNIQFSLPTQNVNGDKTIYIVNGATVTTHDSTMGY